MDNESTEPVTPGMTESAIAAFPIGESQVDPTFCIPCQKGFASPAGKSMHDRWEHNEEGRKVMLAGAKKSAKHRNKDGRYPRLVGKIPKGSRLPNGTGHKCGFCDYPPHESESGLRYHLAKEHKVHSIEANRNALAKREGIATAAEPAKKGSIPPKPVVKSDTISKSEVVATIEVVRIGSEVYGRIATT